MSVFTTFKQSDADAMKSVEREIVKAAIPFRERMPPELVAMAFLRCCRTLLRMCSKEDQQALLPVFVAFLQGKVKAPKDSLLWTPDGGDVLQ